MGYEAWEGEACCSVLLASGRVLAVLAPALSALMPPLLPPLAVLPVSHSPDWLHCSLRRSAALRAPLLLLAKPL